jgi:predicted transcriptional regulator YheO
MTTKTKEQLALIEQTKQIAAGLAQTFAPFCEVVVHDLLDPKHAVLTIQNNLSGRQPGDPATELGLARIADPEYPQVIANYANHFADGRQAKSTSIGIKDSTGKYIAALCLNVDLSIFRSLQAVMDQFAMTDVKAAMKESLDPSGADAIRNRIDQFAANLATTPRALKAPHRRELLKDLKDSGLMDVRRAMEVVAQYLGVSRATVYSDGK